MDEKLELVTDFASLRAGDLVVVKAPCHACGKPTARGMLLRRDKSPAGTLGWYWDSPHFHDGWAAGFAKDVVDEGRVYRVVIPPAAKERETARPKKLERTR